MAEPVEEYVGAVIVARLSRPDARELLSDTKRPDVAALRDESNGLRKRLDALAIDFADGSLTASQLRAATERLRERLTESEAKLSDAGRVDVLGPLIASNDVAAAWRALTVARQRAILAMLVRVTIYPPGRGTRTFRPETVTVERLP